MSGGRCRIQMEHSRLVFVCLRRSKSAWSWGSACSRRPRRQRGCWCWRRFDRPKTISAVASTTCWWTTAGHTWLLLLVFPNKSSQPLLTSRVCSGRRRVQPFSKRWKKIGEQWPCWPVFAFHLPHTTFLYSKLCCTKVLLLSQKNNKPQ